MDAWYAESEPFWDAARRGIPLADFEDEDGRIRWHERRPMSQLEKDLAPGRVPCRAEGCQNTAPQFGRYAGRCDIHREAAVQEPAQPAPEQEPYGYVPDDEHDELVAAAQEVTARRLAVQQAQDALDDAIARVNELLDAIVEVPRDR
jgi:hypothetical protein